MIRKLFLGSEEDFLTRVKVHPLFSSLSFLFYIAIALILATRDLGLAKDDYNYLAHFYDAKDIQLDKLFLYIIEEPLWKLYTWLMSFLFSPETAFRLTIFLSVFLFLFSIGRINNKAFVFIGIIFILHQDLATQMYFNQIRQGVALSIFLFLCTWKNKPLGGAILATLIHTSFFIPLFLIILIRNVRSVKRLLVYVISGVIVVIVNLSLFKQIDLGRREDSYLFENTFTIYFYIIAFLEYLPLLYMIKIYGSKSISLFWFKLAASSFVAVLAFTSFYSAAGRLMYYVSVFFLVMIIEQYNSKGGKMALTYYFFFIFFKLNFLDNNVFHSWKAIMGV